MFDPFVGLALKGLIFSLFMDKSPCSNEEKAIPVSLLCLFYIYNEFDQSNFNLVFLTPRLLEKIIQQS